MHAPKSPLAACLPVVCPLGLSFAVGLQNLTCGVGIGSQIEFLALDIETGRDCSVFAFHKH